ncbi:hypothetical protein K491DRAFT_589511 [Lophiostoma macrostomum CBS 122681]|uniref:Histone deacetylase n=1 Tax=Lophiostoma macrostomum CBS 122681 TaxID=1314788 RepID=A0A6A6TMK9_9PLEO|nr:hypothetical protein K491DRAFT_589511 [Lophiostoma macrostomum CBS 122681]
MDPADDYIMGEDSIVESTETNGNYGRDTVDPSLTILPRGVSGPFTSRKAQLPIVGHGGSAGLRLSSNQSSIPVRPGDSSATHSDAGSEDMDFSISTVSSVQVRIPPPPRFSPLPYATSKTGLVYDARMRLHSEPLTMTIREEEIHPEDPRRIHEIFQEIQQAGLVQGPEEDEEDAKEDQCWRIQARHATKGEVCLIHTIEHYDFIESLQEKSDEELAFLGVKLDSIYFHNSTFDCARLAAGGAIEACRAVVRGDVRNAIAIIRPPGHHAECDQPSGFCIFNNVPIATRVCQGDFPDICRKVLILDWDVHHGNGIQHAFYQDPNVLYVSLHVYKNGEFYPGLVDGNLDHCGEGPGLGKNVNIPWSEHGMGDAEYIYAFQEVVVPIAAEFDPDLVIISAGFDAAEGDVLGGCHVTPACYAHMTHMLMRLAKGKLTVCLEGGYNLRSIARSALAVTRTLMLQPPDRLAADLKEPKLSAIQVVEQVKRQHSKYWKCMYPKLPDRKDTGFESKMRLHDVIREWQSKTFSETHQMMPLTIKRSGIAQTFEHNVIATPHFMDAHPLLVIFHDPPGVMNRADPITGRVELHNIWLTDASKSYIEWAIQDGFQVIDVNIPKVVDFEDDKGDFARSDDPELRGTLTRNLANYIWENYIEPNDATQVYLMGIGAAYLGLVDLLSLNENTTVEGTGVEHLIGFVSETPVHSIKRTTDDSIANWFFAHSHIFVANSHNAWSPERRRKPRRKYGQLVRSDYDDLNQMMESHRPEIQELLQQKRKDNEEERKASRLDDEEQQGLRSPPLPMNTPAQRLNNGNGRTARASTPTSPRLPQMG